MPSKVKWKEYAKELSELSVRCNDLCDDIGRAGLSQARVRMESVASTVQAEVAAILAKKRGGKKNPEGWVWLGNSTDCHYFRDGKSLCGRWLLPLEPKFTGRDPKSSFNCKSCRNALQMTKES